MSNLFYIHIGLHKTATTSMQQDIFPYIDGVRFLGRKVIPLKKQDVLYKIICHYCFSMEEDESLFEDIKEKIANSLEKEPLLLSDEWFTADYSGFYGFDGAPWQEKLRRLSKLLKPFDHKVMITLREPVKGIFSQYCEFNTVGIQKKYTSFESYALTSNDAAAYHYDEFFTSLKGFFTDISLFKFESIVQPSGQKEIADFFGVEKIRVMGNHNQKKKSNEGVEIVVSNKFFLFLLGLIPLSLKDRFKKSRFAVSAREFLISIFSKKDIIPSPSGDELLRIESFYKKSHIFYKRIADNHTGKK